MCLGRLGLPKNKNQKMIIQRKYRNTIATFDRVLYMCLPLTWIYASNRRTQTTRQHSTMHRPTVPALWMWIRFHDRKFPKGHHKLQPWCWRTWKRKFSSSVFLALQSGSFQSTRKSAVDKVHETDMNKQYVEYVRASVRSKKSGNCILQSV